VAVIDSLASVFTQITPPDISPVFFWGAFVIVYGISFSSLTKLNLFEDNTRLVMLVSFAIAIMVAISPAVANVLSASLPTVGILIVFFVCALLAVNILAPGWILAGKSRNYVVITVFIIVGLVFMSGVVDNSAISVTSTYIDFFGTRVQRADLEVVIAVAVIGMFMFLISGSIKRGGKEE